MTISMIGLDTAKSVFQVHGVDAAGKAALKRKLRREEVIPFFEQQERCTVVLEACGAGHHWARVLTQLGHEAKLLAPEAARPVPACSALRRDVAPAARRDRRDRRDRWGGRLPTASMCQSAGRLNQQREPSVMTISMIGLDTAKSVFQVHGVDAAGKPQLKRKLRREEGNCSRP